MTSHKRKVTELSAGDVDPVIQSLVPFMASLDRDDERTAGVVDMIESLFFKLKQGSVCYNTPRFELAHDRSLTYLEL